MSILFLKMVIEKWRKVPDGVLAGYCHGMGKVRSTWSVLLRRWKWSCVIDLVYETKRLTPFLEILQKMFYKCFY
jgi:hypothetical protein